MAYWDNLVDAYFDLATGTIIVTVRAFTPADALRINNAIIAATEKLVDSISLQARRDAVRVDEQEVASAAQKLRDINAEILDYRNRVQLLDPKQEADNTLSLLLKLQQDLSDANTTLVTMRQTMAPSAPTVQALNHRILALKQQIAALRAQLTTSPDSKTNTMSQGLGGFEALDARQIQQAYYSSVLETLSQSRETADRKMAYLSVFEQPNLPEMATYPNRLKSIGLTFMAALGAWIMMTSFTARCATTCRRRAVGHPATTIPAPSKACGRTGDG